MSCCNKHVLGCLNDCITSFDHENITVLKVVIWHVTIDCCTPSRSSGITLVAFGIRVSCDEDSLIWNYHVLLLCNFRLTPLEIKNIIRKEFPILAKIVSVEDFFVDFAFFIFKFFTACPGCCHTPSSFSWVENKFFDLSSRIKSFYVTSAVFRNPIYSFSPYVLIMPSLPKNTTILSSTGL